MSGYNFALAVHVIAIVAMFCCIAIVLVCMGGTRRAQTTQAMREWAKTGSMVAWALPVLAVIAYIPGGYMASDHKYNKDAWVQVASVALVLMLIAFIVMAIRFRPLARATATAPDGAVTVDLQRRALDPLLWLLAQAVSTLGVGVIILMTTKPGGGVSIIVFVVALVLGLLSAAPNFARLQRLQA